MPLINVLTPFPGPSCSKPEKEGRILHRDWSQYDAKHWYSCIPVSTRRELRRGIPQHRAGAYTFDSIWKKLNYYWEIVFWKNANELDPVKFSYRLIFALRLVSMIFSRNTDRSKFILKVLPKVFNPRVRISTILTLMAYNDFATSLEKEDHDAPGETAPCAHRNDEAMGSIPVVMDRQEVPVIRPDA
jgi:hypothetical protein